MYGVLQYQAHEILLSLAHEKLLVYYILVRFPYFFLYKVILPYDCHNIVPDDQVQCTCIEENVIREA